MPKAWTSALWLKDTDVPGIFSGTKKRSPLLLAVDRAFHNYDHAVPMHRVRALHQLQDAFADWSNSKDDPASSIRNAGNQLADFRQWLADEQASYIPARETGWNGTPNCYAYAMKCETVAGNAPTPGAAAGAAVLPGDARWRDVASKVQYHAALLDGIVADGARCGKVVEILRGPVHNAYPSPLHPPIERCGGDSYLAGMVAKTDGFHFMRRDSVTGLWSQKNGGGDAEVDTSAVLLGVGGHDPHQTPITDRVAVELLQCITGKYLAFAGFQFVGYVLVPHSGITVAGAF